MEEEVEGRRFQTLAKAAGEGEEEEEARQPQGPVSKWCLIGLASMPLGHRFLRRCSMSSQSQRILSRMQPRSGRPCSKLEYTRRVFCPYTMVSWLEEADDGISNTYFSLYSLRILLP